MATIRLSYLFCALAVACASDAQDQSTKTAPKPLPEADSQAPTADGGSTESDAAVFAGAPSIAIESTMASAPDSSVASVFEVAEPEVPPSFRRGFNFGNRLDAPNEGEWGPALQEVDFATVSERGFDHVRLPVRFSAHAAQSAPFTLDVKFLERVDWAIEQILGHGMSVVLDFQYYDEFMAKPDAHLERFLALWAQISERYSALPPHVAFELLSEPNGELGATYNQVVASAVELIRRSNPERRLIVDTFEYARTTTLQDLQLPADDDNLVVSVHVYTPREFVLQGVEWAGAQYGTLGVVFPGPPAEPIEPIAAALADEKTRQWFEQYNTLPTAENPSGPSGIEAPIRALVDYREAEGHEVYIGEFGITLQAPEDSRFRFVELLRSRCEEEGIGWAVWDNNGADMAVLGETPGTWRDSTIDALVPLE